MRVIYVGSPELFSKGASSIHIMKMCQAMGRLGIDAELIMPLGESRSKVLDYYGVESNFRITPFPYFKNSTVRNIVHGILSSIYIWSFRKNRYDVVLTRNIVFTYFAAKLFKIPTIYDAHHPLVKGGAFLFDSFKSSKYLRNFSTNSKGLADIYLDLGLPPEKLVVAHNGVDQEKFKDLPPVSDIRKNLGLPTNKKIVCYSGNIYEGRGVEQLIDVAQKLKDVLFLIVGGLKEDVDRCMSLVESKGVENFSLAGFVPHEKVSSYLRASDLLVMPYTSKMVIKGGTKAQDFTSPIKLFEYMAAGRPIVATSIPSVREILRDGENAVLVEPGSLDSLCQGIEKVLNDNKLARKIADKAKSDVNNYSWEDRVRKILNI